MLKAFAELIDTQIPRLLKPRGDSTSDTKSPTSDHELIIKKIIDNYYPDSDQYQPVNLSCPNDSNYISPLHQSILLSRTSWVRVLLENGANIIYYSTPSVSHDLMMVAIQNPDENIAINVFNYGVRRYGRPDFSYDNLPVDELVEKLAATITHSGTNKLENTIKYLEAAIDNNKPNLSGDILKGLHPHEKDTQLLLTCFNKAISKTYADLAAKILMELPPEIGLNCIYSHLKDIDESYISEYLRIHNIKSDIKLFELALKASKFTVAYNSSADIEDLDRHLVALIQKGLPATEGLLHFALAKGLRSTVKLLFNKNCPGKETVLEFCINNQQANLACELIAMGANFNLTHNFNPLWVRIFNEGIYTNLLCAMIRKGLSLDSIASYSAGRIHTNDNVLDVSLRGCEWQVVLEILKTKPALEKVEAAFEKVKGTLSKIGEENFDGLIQIIASECKNEAMIPYLEIILSHISTLPAHAFYIGKALYKEGISDLAYILLSSLKVPQITYEQYKEARSICGHIVLTNGGDPIKDTESEQSRHERVESAVDHFIEAGDAKLTRFLLKDLYTPRQQKIPAATLRRNRVSFRP
ncbi:MAG: hypothetical protein JSR17_01750 [Proteobacteria bacterium]|nr:hypothetical protein [Pseudomonadota bacterium]